MATRIETERSPGLVEELQRLESFFPLLGGGDETTDLDEEIDEIEQLIAAAGEPEDEHSLRALTFLQTELLRMRRMRDGFY